MSQLGLGLGLTKGGGTTSSPVSTENYIVFGADRLVRPLSDTTTNNLIAPDSTLYNITPI